MTQPLAIDLFCGLFGWSEGLVAEGWRTIGVDLEDMRGQFGFDPLCHTDLMLRDVTTIHGSLFRDADLIVGSSPCQEFSYRAMPWKRAKALGPPLLGIKLFKAQFRIQREASEAAGRHIPMVVENVRGAERWVGRARYAYGSFLLWGDVPALMPQIVRSRKLPGFRFDGSGRSFQSVSVEGTKNGNDWFGSGDNCSLQRRAGSKSSARKFASAMIAKIPETLARHIAVTFHPRRSGGRMTTPVTLATKA